MLRVEQVTVKGGRIDVVVREHTPSLSDHVTVRLTHAADQHRAVLTVRDRGIGLEPDLPNGRVTLRPVLLPGINHITFEEIRIGGRSLTIKVWRVGDSVRCEVLGADDLQVLIDPS